MTDRIWILGAPDPEMTAIEALLTECGERVAYALDDRGERVHAGSAYRGVSHYYATDCGESGRCEAWYMVECAVPVPDAAQGVMIDHHRPGDPGYGRPPAEFLAASSIGQVISELARLDRLPASWPWTGAPEGHDKERGLITHWHDQHGVFTSTVVTVAYNETGDGSYGCDGGQQAIIPRDLVLTSAADHCLGAAYRGECPGVDPDALMRWRVETRAKHQGRRAEDVLADVEQVLACDCPNPSIHEDV